MLLRALVIVLRPTVAPPLGTQRFRQVVTRIRTGHATDKKRYSMKMTGTGQKDDNCVIFPLTLVGET